MPQLIVMREWYERKRAQLLELYAATDDPYYRLLMANKLSKLEARWLAINRNISKKLLAQEN